MDKHTKVKEKMALENLTERKGEDIMNNLNNEKSQQTQEKAFEKGVKPMDKLTNKKTNKTRENVTQKKGMKAMSKVINKKNQKTLENLETRKAAFFNDLRQAFWEGYLPGPEKFDFLVALCMLTVAAAQPTCPQAPQEVFQLLGKEAGAIAADRKVDVAWPELSKLVRKYDFEQLRDLLAHASGSDVYADAEEEVPVCLVRLAGAILAPQAGEKIYHINAKSGFLLGNFAADYPDCAYYGTIKSKKAGLRDLKDLKVLSRGASNVAAAVLRSAALGANFQLDLKSVFHSKQKASLKYDKIVSTHPLGLKPANLELEASKRPEFSRPLMSADWLYCLALMERLSARGKAVAFVAEGCLYKKQDKEARRYFVENGLIEAVVKLPQRLYASTAIPLALLVLSHNNKKTRLLDFSENYHEGRRRNELSSQQIEEVLQALLAKSLDKGDFTLASLSAKDFELLPPQTSQQQTIASQDRVALETLASILPARALSAAEMDAYTLSAQEAGDIYYLRGSELADGLLARPLPKLKAIPEHLAKYLLEDGDVLLSRNSVPLKLGYYRQRGSEQVLAIGNLYILRADKSKLNPLYLKAYLESEMGRAALKKCVTGINVPVISLMLLKKLILPLPGKAAEERIAKRYLALLDELETLKNQAEKIKRQLARVTLETKER